MKCFCVKSRMLMKIILASILLVGLFSSQCFAAEYGLGISVEDNDPRIFIPINITDNFRTELSLYYGASERDSSTSSSESEGYEFGLGLFGLKNLYENTQIYYGCRFLYFNGKSKYEDKSSGVFFSPSRNSDYKAYSVAPTLGIEYFMTENIALGGEFEFHYEDSSYEYDDSTDDSDYTSTGTDTRLILRYYFK